MINRHNRAYLPCCRFLLPLFLCLSFLAGCRDRNDLVERQNHDLEVALRDAHEKLQESRAYVEAIQHELDATRAPQVLGQPLPPPLQEPSYDLKSVRLTRQTGGINTDNLPGDNALQIVFEPIDADGHAVKAPGSLDVELLQVGKDNVRTVLSAWQVSSSELRLDWRTGLFGSGYTVILPWKVWPNVESLRVALTFTLANGGSFSDEKNILVKLRPEKQRGPLPIDPKDGPALEVPLPPPRKLDLPPSDGPRLDSSKRADPPRDPQHKSNIQAVSGTFELDLGTPQLRK